MVRVPLDAFVDVVLRIPRLDPLPPLDGGLRRWPPEGLLPDLTGLHDQVAFGRAWAGWSPQGLAFAFDVEAGHDLWGDPDHPYRSDGVEVWVDTRDSRDAKKPTPYCHHLVVVAGAQGAVAVGLRVGGSAPPDERERLGHVRAEARGGTGRARGRYGLEVFLAAEAMDGYAPLESGSVGLAYRLRSSRRAVQDLSFGDAFPLWRNPSLWRSARLEG
jgi:hypothetical protein